MMQDSAVAPGFSPACAALKGGATYVALYITMAGPSKQKNSIRPTWNSWRGFPQLQPI